MKFKAITIALITYPRAADCFFARARLTEAAPGAVIVKQATVGGKANTTCNLQPDFVWEPYLIYNGANSSAEMTVLWKSVTSTNCSTCWDTPDPATSVCHVATTGDLGPLFTSPEGDHYQYTISGLTSSTRYNYNVTCGNTTISGGSFTTPPPDPSTGPVDTKFLAYGDTRTNPGKHDIVAQQMLNDSTGGLSEYANLALHVGDYVSSGQCMLAWDGQIFDSSYKNIRELMRKVPLNGGRGNHENDCDSPCNSSTCTRSDFSTLFNEIFPHPYVNFTTGDPTSPDALSYSFNYGNIHVAVVDQYSTSGGSYADGPCPSYSGPKHECQSCDVRVDCPSQHYEWLKNDLTNANDWKIVVIHAPLYSAGGNHPNEVEPAFEELLGDQKMDMLVLAGHNHYYSRAEKTSSVATSKTIQHITTGGGGAPIAFPVDPLPSGIVAATAKYHYCRLHAHTPDPSSSGVSDYFCFEAIDICGCMLDSFEFGTRPSPVSHVCGDRESDPKPPTLASCQCCTDVDCNNTTNPCSSSKWCDPDGICQCSGAFQFHSWTQRFILCISGWVLVYFWR